MSNLTQYGNTKVAPLLVLAKEQGFVFSTKQGIRLRRFASRYLEVKAVEYHGHKVLSLYEDNRETRLVIDAFFH
jgi:hypothetical protein